MNGNDSSSYSHKLHADFKHNFDGNTIETLTENEIHEKHVCKNWTVLIQLDTLIELFCT